MRRVILVVCVLGVLAAVICIACFLVRRNQAARILARANVALRADQPDKALQLAGQYVSRAPGDSRGYLVCGLAYLRLGSYPQAREALKKAIEIDPLEVSGTIALARSYMLPAIQTLQASAEPAMSELLDSLTELQKAGDLLRAAGADDRIGWLGLRQTAASNTMCMARIRHKITDKLADDLKLAQAGHATEHSNEIRRRHEAAAAEARSLELQAAENLCRVLAEAKELLAGDNGKPQRAELTKYADTAARDLVQFCVDLNCPEQRWRNVRQAVKGFDGVSPVAAAMAAVYDVRSGKFPSDSQRRKAIAQTCRQLDGLLEVVGNSREDRTQILLPRAALALTLKDFETADRTCREVLKHTPAQPTARLLLAQARMARGQFAEAEKALFVLKTELPQSAEIAFAYGRAARASGKDELACNAMQTVIQLDPRHAAARAYLIERYLGEGYLEQAYAQAHEYYVNCREDPVALTLLAEAGRATNRPAMAEKAAEQTLKDFADRPEMLVAAGDAYSRLGDAARSAEAIRKAAEARATDTVSRLAVARALALTGQVARAESILTRDLAEDGDLPVVRFETGRLYAATGRLMQAAEQYQAAADREPDNTAYRLALAEAMLRMGNLRRSADALEALAPEDPRANFLRLQLRLLQDKPVGAADLIAQGWHEWRESLGLATALLNRGQPAQCLEVCLKELDSSGADADWNILTGQAYLAMGQPDKCQEHWISALAAAPNRLDIYLRLARLLAQREPCDQISGRLAAMPGAEDQLAALAAGMLQSETGRHAEAIKVCRSLTDRRETAPWVRNRARFLLAHSLAITNETQKALAELDALAQDNRCADEAMLAKGRLLEIAGRHGEAMGTLADLRARARGRSDTDLMQQIAEVYKSGGEGDLAIACCDDILAMPGGQRKGNLIKAQLHLFDGRADLAAVCYRKVIETFPNDLPARCGLAKVLDAQCRHTEAWQVLQDMEPMGAAARAKASLAKAELLAGWGLHDQAVKCFAAVAEAGYAENPAVQLAAGVALANAGERDKAREHLRRIGRYSAQRPSAQIALAGLSASSGEAMSILNELDAAYPGSDAILAESMRVLLRDGNAAQAAARFRSFVLAHCRGRAFPQPAAMLALQAHLETGAVGDAWELASQTASQTGKPWWRRMAGLLASAPEAPETATAAPTDTTDVLIGVVNAFRFADPKTLAIRAAQFDRISRGSDDACPPAYRILVALIAGDSGDMETIARAASSGYLVSMPLEALASCKGGQRARKILDNLAPGELPDTLRAAAAALTSCENPDRQKKQAAELLRATLAADMGVNAFAHRLAMELLSADNTCQWAAVLAASTRSDQQSLRKVLSMMRPGDCAARVALEGELRFLRGEYQQSAQAFREAGRLIGAAPHLGLRQAIATEKTGNLTEALALYRQVLSGARGQVAAVAANNAAYIVATLWPADKTRLLEAYAWSGAAVEACPNMPAFRDTRGWVAHLLGRKDEACLELRKALREMSDSPELHTHLAEAETAAGNRELAGWHRQAAQRLSHRDAPAGARFAETRQARGAAMVDRQ